MKLASLFLLSSLASATVWSAESEPLVEDEAAIRENIEAYVTAFNQGDASAVATFWAPSGVWVSPDGFRVTGREAIQESMARYFQEGRGQQLSISDLSVRFVTPAVAVEEGKARVLREGEAPSDTSYVAIHVKEEGQWKLDTVREVALPVAASNYAHLRDLEWMVGTWVDEGDGWTIRTSCQWTKNKNFMTRTFHVARAGRVEMEGTQVIGYDAANRQIRSWVFDSDGGLGEGIWSQYNDRWIVKNRHTLPTGETGSSINVITHVDDNTMLWQSTGREIDGRMMPDIEPVTIVRQTE